MCEQIIKDAQEIQKRLINLGQTDVSEGAICDLLRCCGSQYALDTIIDMIVGSENKNDSTKPGPSNETHKRPQNTENVNETNLPFHFASSDSDVENDNNAPAVSSEDDSLPDSNTPDIPPPMTTIHFQHNTSATILTRNERGTVDVQVLEGNNSNSNDNSNSIEIEEESFTVDIELHSEAESINSLEAPKSNYDTELSDTDSFTSRRTIQKEANQICALLPNLKYAIVYRELFKNRNARNRVELTLWDLLPGKRPIAQFLQNRHIENIPADGVIDLQQLNSQNSSIDIYAMDNTKPFDNILRADRMSNIKLKRKGTHMLRPAKLQADHIYTPDARNVPRNTPILMPPKLQHVPNTMRNAKLHKTSVSRPPNHGMKYLQTMHPGKNNRFFPSFEEYGPSAPYEDNRTLPNNTVCNQSHNMPGNFMSPNSRFVRAAYKNLTNECRLGSAQTMQKSENFHALNGMHAAYNNASKYNGLPNTISSNFTPEHKNLPGITETSNKFPSERGGNSTATANCDEVETSSKTPKSSSLKEHSLLDSSSGTEKMSTKERETNEILYPVLVESYSRLISMFPGVDVDYIKELCYSDLKTNEYKDIKIDNLIEHFIIHGNKRVPVRVMDTEQSLKQILDPKTHMINQKYAELLELFPDIDLIYLRDSLEDIYDSPNCEDACVEFVLLKLKDKDYPTKQQTLAKTRIIKQREQYTTKFNIEEFLQIIPEPFEYFENRQRECKFEADAFEYLKARFNFVPINALNDTYTRCGYNLTLTTKCLTEERGTPIDIIYVSPSESIPLLQEIAFIQHKTEINEHLANFKAKEAREIENLKASNNLLECECCYQNDCRPSACSTCDEGHIFCNQCIIQGAKSTLSLGKTRVACFQVCKSEFSLSTLQRVLPPTQFSILLHKRQEAEVLSAGLEGLVSCPFCHFASIPPPDDKVFKCLNPDCMKESCRECKQLNHVPLKCDELYTDKVRTYVEEKLTQALLRKCYQCNRPFFKDEGCNKIYCVCGALMCYLCDAPINGYGHFERSPDSPTGCPLYSDNRLANDEAVRQVADTTLKNVKKKYPNVKLDIHKVLPEGNDRFGIDNKSVAERVKKVIDDVP